MKIFLSWSGAISCEVAAKLRTWLRSVIQATDPWMSRDDISAGSIWFGEINENIRRSKFGIICVTRENKKAPWLLWEAGALFRGYEDAQSAEGGGAGGGARRVVPL